jgi:hypothetical protein
MLSLFFLYKLCKNKYFLSSLKILTRKRLCLCLIFLFKPVVIKIKISFYISVIKREEGSKAVVNTLIFKELKLSCIIKAVSC